MFRDIQSPQEFRQGEMAEVVCDVISSPVPVVVWYYQEREITEEQHSKAGYCRLSNDVLSIIQNGETRHLENHVFLPLQS